MASRLMLRASIVRACGPWGVVTMNARGLSTRRASHRLPPSSAKTATPDRTVSSARAHERLHEDLRVADVPEPQPVV